MLYLVIDMTIVDIRKDNKYLDEYCKLCSLEWGMPKSEDEMYKYIQDKKEKILTGNKVISILGLIDNSSLIGFISLFKYDGDERNDLTPWYATMYVKSEYRGNGYSRLLNAAIIDEAKRLGYNKIYLKTNLNNYYEKFGAEYIEDLKCGEKLYSLDCITKNH